MRHAFIDQYAECRSPIHSLDPRLKLLSFLILLICVVTVSPGEYGKLAIYTALTLLIVFLSKIPVGFIAKRTLQIFPFILVIALFIPFMKNGVPGWHLFLTVLARGVLAVVILTVFLNSMPFSQCLKAMRFYRVPALFTSIMAFMYRYLFLIQDECERMFQAKASRTLRRNWPAEVRTFANIAGSLFIRSFERSERVYQAMCARGFRGE
ncbi:MAG: cobalt ECF transporter T component CbiQ [Candidatus Omnitrophica bacterium]|nr:cobalt ECF transporter T component CbiQ [Candidatus Omnitrophota bacterium]